MDIKRFQILYSDGEDHYADDYQYIEDQDCYIVDIYKNGEYHSTEEITAEEFDDMAEGEKRRLKKIWNDYASKY